MDCRRSFLLILVLAVGGGCLTTSNKVPLPLEPPLPEKTKKEKKVVKQQPKPETCVTFGQCFENLATAASADQAAEMKVRDNARLAYQQALQLEPHNLEAWIGLARVYSLQGDYQRAQDTYQKGLAKFPKETRLWHDLGMCHARAKDWDQAIRSFQKAVELDPENRRYLQQLGFCLARAGQTDDSLTCLSRVMGPAQAHYQVARMMLHLKKNDLCRQHLQLALEANPQLEEARQMMAQVQDAPPPDTQQAVDQALEPDNTAPGQN